MDKPPLIDETLRDGRGEAPPKARAPRPDSRGELSIVAQPLRHPEHPQALELLAFWEQARQGGRLLNKRDIPCARLRGLLPHLYLFEPVDEAGSDWRCRLVGGAIRERYGGPNQLGRRLFETDPPEIAARRARNYRSVVSGLCPLSMRGRLLNIGRDFYEVEVINLPVASARGVLWVLGGMFFFE